MSEPRFKGWPTVELGAVATVNDRLGDVRAAQGKKLLFIDFKGTPDEPGLIVEPAETMQLTPPAGSRVVRGGDVLLAKHLPHTGKARTAVVGNLGGRLAFVERFFHVIRPGRRLSAQWLRYLLRQTSLTGFMNRGSGGLGTAGEVTPQVLKALPIPLPPVAAQKRIISLLDEAEDARRLRKEAAAEMERAFTAAFYEMFGEVERNPKGWERVQLSSLVERVEKGVTPGTGTMRRPAGEGEYGLLKVAAVASGKFLPGENFALGTSAKATNLRPVEKDDLLMVSMGARGSLGASALVKESGTGLFPPETLWRLVPQPGVDVHFLKAFLSAPQTRQHMRDIGTGGVARLSQNQLLLMPAFRPPAAAQQRFAELYRAMSEAETMQDELGAELDGLFDAMLSRAYTSRPPTTAKVRAKKAATRKGRRATRKRVGARVVAAEPPAASAVSEAGSRIIWGKLSDFQRAVWAATLSFGRQFRVGELMSSVKVPAGTSADRERFLSALDLLVSLGAVIKEGRVDADRWRCPDPENDQEVG